jgi:ribosomal protein L11 methyltransferase
VKRGKHRQNTWWTGKIRTVDVGKRLRLVPYWESAAAGEDRLNILIDPGPSFGSGDHPSTVMALELLEIAMERRGPGTPRPSVLDVGTGTGVLAITARALGAGDVVGLDIDSSAVFTARRNLKLNGPTIRRSGGEDEIPFFVGTARAAGGVFDVVMANLAAPTLIRLFEDLTELTGSHLILSGIADAMEARILETYVSGGLDLLRHMKKEGWNAFLFTRPEK